MFLSAVTELTATLILIPTNAETLATQFWAYQQNLSYGQAAPFALVIIAIAAVPSYVLGRFFDRLPRRGSARHRRSSRERARAHRGLQVLRGPAGASGTRACVTPGSFTSILGPSGSGKTTLLRVIAGFEHAEAGIGPRRWRACRRPGPLRYPRQASDRIVPQDGSLFPHLSVAHNVGFGLSRTERHGPKVAELIEMVGLGGLERRYPAPAFRRPTATCRPRSGPRHRPFARLVGRAVRFLGREPAGVVATRRPPRARRHGGDRSARDP